MACFLCGMGFFGYTLAILLRHVWFGGWFLPTMAGGLIQGFRGSNGRLLLCNISAKALVNITMTKSQ